MMYTVLKRLRIGISLVFLLVLGFSFMDFAGKMPVSVTNAFTWLQFIPSLLKFLYVLGISATGFLFISFISLLFGRVYCSLICPLGVMQDVVSYFSRKLKIRKKVYRFSKAYHRLSYGILAIAVIVFLLGSVLAFNLLDPYSNFGKIFSDLMRPLYAWINNLGAGVLGHFKVYWLAPVDLMPGNPYTLIFPAIFLILVVWLALTKGRLYCNTVCPVGSFLGLLSKVSLFKINIDHISCDRCGKCSVACKSMCIDIKYKTVDFSRCVGCFNCLQVCPHASIRYRIKPAEPINTAKNVDESKRGFIVKSIVSIITLSGISRLSWSVAVQNKKPTTIPEKKSYAVSPPGSISIGHFNDKCTACHLCVSACPTKVLKPALFEYGLIGMMQPRMDYQSVYCNFECIACCSVCPTGAIMPLTVEQKKRTQTGKVVFVKENCIPWVENTACGSCSEHCPTQAVKMVTFGKGVLTMPHTNIDICIGCGACESACPTRPFKAIFVDGNAIHQLANKPPVEKVQEKAAEEFPF